MLFRSNRPASCSSPLRRRPGTAGLDETESVRHLNAHLYTLSADQDVTRALIAAPYGGWTRSSTRLWQYWQLLIAGRDMQRARCVIPSPGWCTRCRANDTSALRAGLALCCLERRLPHPGTQAQLRALPPTETEAPARSLAQMGGAAAGPPSAGEVRNSSGPPLDKQLQNDQAFKLQGLILTHDGFVRMRVRRRERRGDKDGAVACWANATVASCSGGPCDDGDSADGGVARSFSP